MIVSGVDSPVPAIAGVGVFIPHNQITNAELAASFNTYVAYENTRRARLDLAPLMESSAQFIEQVSGIKSRYVIDREGVLDPDILAPRIPDRADEELSVQAEFAISAARQAIRNAGLLASDIDLVICSCVHHQRPYPAISVEIQKALGCTGAAFDMSVACASTAFALHVAATLIRGGGARHILVCSPEIMSGHLNFRDRNSHFIFGDASAAAVITNMNLHKNSAGILGPVFEIIQSTIWTSFSNNIRSNFGFLNRASPETAGEPDKLFCQHGNRVFKEIVLAAGRHIRQLLDEATVPTTEVECFWLHQANQKLINALINYLDSGISPNRVPIILDEIGNVGSPGALIAFQRTADVVSIGGVGVLCAFGAGYSVGCLLLKRLK